MRIPPELLNKINVMLPVQSVPKKYIVSYSTQITLTTRAIPHR
jgi:hypothetical protein